MKIKAALIDLDDTICDTKPLYDEAIPKCHRVFNAWTDLNWSEEQFREAYGQAKAETKVFTPSAASQHNRAIYFQKLVENLEIQTDFDLIHELYRTYYDHIYHNMKLYPNAIEILEWLDQTDRKIIVVSNGNAHVRIKKIHALKIAKYIDFMVSSEEAGISKPASQPYLLALNKARLHPEEVVMIGSAPGSDIYGANKLGIVTIQTLINGDPSDKPSNKEEKPRYTVNNLLKVKDIIEYIENN
jgi:putative hydrolase of the HAD superfamily